MRQSKLPEFKDGWVIGNFEPSLWKTSHVEIALKRHKQGSYWPRHKQLIALEYNIVVSGLVSINGKLFEKDDIFVIEPNECTKPYFVTDCEIVCIKKPSIPGDKVEC